MKTLTTKKQFKFIKKLLEINPKITVGKVAQILNILEDSLSYADKKRGCKC